MRVTTEQLLLIAVIAIIVLGALVLALVGYLAGSRGRLRRPGGLDAAVSLPTSFEPLAPAFGELRSQLAEVRGKLDQLRAVTATEQTEKEAYDLLQRLTARLLGSATAGATGERVVEEMLDALPAQWRVTNLSVAGQRVEFAIKLPDGLLLPIDSKVVAQSELEQLDQTSDPAQREQLEKRIRANALKRVGEVRQYVDERTPGFAIAAVSDAIYGLCGPILPKAYTEQRALIVPYSLLGPFILMVFEQHRRGALDLDVARQANLLADAESHLEKATQELNGRLGSAMVQLGNGRDALARELGEATRALSLVRSTAGEKAGTNGARH
jgi:hypothetical protein